MERKARVRESESVEQAGDERETLGARERREGR
jgi:hypothetical protein